MGLLLLLKTEMDDAHLRNILTWVAVCSVKDDAAQHQTAAVELAPTLPTGSTAAIEQDR